MLRPLDAKLHYRIPQQTGEYFGKDCGKLSVPHGQGSNSGIIRTAQDVYPCIIPYKERQLTELNKPYDTPHIGDRPMHATTMQYRPVKPVHTSVTRYVSHYHIFNPIKLHNLFHCCCKFVLFLVFYNN